MKKSIEEKFLDFKVRHGLSNEDIVKIVTEYANSDLSFARSYFKDKYLISENAFYKARDYAVIFCLVDASICEKLKLKAAANYSMNNRQSSARASLAHFNDLITQRSEFLNSFSNSDIRHIATKYVENVSIQNIAAAFGTGDFAIKYLLRKGIVNLILDADTVRQIHAMRGASLDKILLMREMNKNALLDCIQSEINFLCTQIELYEFYFMDSENKPTLQDLDASLSNARNKYQKTLQL